MISLSRPLALTILTLTATSALGQVGSISGHSQHATRVAPVPIPTGVRVSGASAAVDVTTVDLATGVESSPVLSGIQILPLEVIGRSQHSDFGHHEGRVVPVGDAQLVQLPNSGVRVVHYRRSNPTRFGFFSVSTQGEIRPLIERPGVGPGNSLNAFHPAVATAPDGATIAVSSASYSGGIDGIGDTWLLRAGGAPFAGGSFLRELTGPGENEADGTSLVFFAGRLLATRDDSLASAPADGSALFTAMPVPGVPANGVVVEEFAMSKDGTALALLGGLDEDMVDLFLMHQDFSIDRLTQNPGAIQPPGYLPEEPAGPHLTLSDDGSLVALDREIQNGHELYLMKTALGSPEVHVTPDNFYEHSIDNISGVLSGGSLSFTFFADSGQQNADLYSARLNPDGTLSLLNLSKTSGASTPFFPNLATISVAGGRTVEEARMFVDQNSPTNFDLWYVDSAGGQSQVSTSLGVAPKLATSPGGDLLVTAAATPNGTVVSWTGGSAPQTLVVIPSPFALNEMVVAPGGNVVALGVDLGPASYVLTLDIQSGAIDWIGDVTFPGAYDLLFGAANHLLFNYAGSAGDVSVAYSLVDGSFSATAPSASSRWLR